MTANPDPPVDTKLIGIIHDALRRDLGRTLDALSTRTPIDAARRAALADHLTWTLAFLRHHHTSEDENLWPPVRQRSPSATPLLDHMTSNHARIHRAATAVEHAASAYRHTDATAARDGLRGALERLCTVLLPQLDREEHHAAPLAADTLTPHEWATWLHHHPLGTTSPTQLTRETYWLTDTLDPPRRHYLTRRLRPRRRSLRTLSLGREYRHRTRLLWTPTTPPTSRIRAILHLAAPADPTAA